MNKLYYLDGKIQNYAWGGFEFISELLSISKDGRPLAEYWLGAHSNASSSIKINEESVSLDAFLNERIEEKLGERVTAKFGRLPFLFKVLDVNEMLSIQVHPTKIEAEKGFKKENELGIPLTAAHRNYKDNNHKPEIMVALSDFWLLHGFLSKNLLLNRLKSVQEFKSLIPIFETKGYFGLYKTVMQYSQIEVNKILIPLIDRILPEINSNKLQKSNPDYWAAKTYSSSENKADIDRGIFSIYFFNIVKVNKGEAIFQDAGVPHAYLEGQNMELMANSDNVLRGGLTPKHIDVDELLKHVKFEETIPNLIKGSFLENEFERVYKSPAKDFELSQIQLLENQKYNQNSEGIQILFVLKGNGKISSTSENLEIKKGTSILVLANANIQIETDSHILIYKASVPL